MLPLPAGQTIAVETVGLTAHQAFVSSLIEKWLSRGGLLLPKDGTEALIAKVTLDAFGTLQDQTFFGIPPIGGGFIPLSLPELTFYKAVRQRGHARLSIDFVEKATGRLVSATPLHEWKCLLQSTYVFIRLQCDPDGSPTALALIRIEQSTAMM